MAALLPALLGVFCGALITPPYLEHDTAEAIFAWFNFTEGGTWNTIVNVDPNNISQSIEKPVTWWPPGQYIPVGLLHSAGIPLGGSILILAFCSTFLGSLGIAKLAEALNAPRDALPWITAGVATSHHALNGFNSFLGGDSALFMLTPWVILAAWNLRTSGYILCLVLPSLFLFCTYIKHSFPIIAGSILLFIWTENIYQESRNKRTFTIKTIIVTDLPLILSAGIYILLRHLLFNFENSPVNHEEQGYNNVSFQTIALNPILASGNVESLSRIIQKLPERIVGNLDWGVLLLPPLSLGLYIWLSIKRLPLLRLAGISSIICIICIALLRYSGAAVDLHSRHFQIAGMLLIACLSIIITTKGWPSKLARLIIAGSIALGGWTLVRRAYFTRSLNYPSIQHLTIKGEPEVLEKIREIGMSPGKKLIAITEPVQAIYLNFTKSPDTRFIYITDVSRQLNAPHRGRFPRIIIPHPKEKLKQNKQTRACFVDYSEDEWETYMIGDWIFAEARTIDSTSDKSGD